MMENKHSLAKVREKFTDWWWNVVKCSFLYPSVFLLAKVVINYILLVDNRMECWTKNYPRRTTVGTAIILGCLFVLDSEISGYLKTPLQRLSVKVENCDFSSNEAESEKHKSYFLSATQGANEMFKKTFEKFGIIAIPTLLISLLDNGKLNVARKLSNSPFFLICYVIPILWATSKTLLIHQRLAELEIYEK